MTNPYNLSQVDLSAITNLSDDELRAIRRNINQHDFSGCETREAVMEYVADGGEIADLLGTNEA